jgi:hypothetical protein
VKERVKKRQGVQGDDVVERERVNGLVSDM